MGIWETLEIEKTSNKREIKKAYAKMAAKYHPEEFPEEFQQVNEAYRRALKYADDEGYVAEMLDTPDVLEEKSRKPTTAFHQKSSKENDIGKQQASEHIDWRSVNQKAAVHENQTPHAQGEEKIDFAHMMGTKNQGRTKSYFEANKKTGNLSPEDEKIVYSIFGNKKIFTDSGKQQKATETEIDFDKIFADAERKKRNIPLHLQLLHQFEVLIDKNVIRGRNAKQWRRLLKSQEFRTVALEPDFLEGFTDILRDVRMTGFTACKTFRAFDFKTIRKMYGDQYIELKKILLSQMRDGIIIPIKRTEKVPTLLLGLFEIAFNGLVMFILGIILIIILLPPLIVFFYYY